MKKAGTMLINNLRYLCLIGVIALGFMTIVATGGDSGGGGDNGGDEPANRICEQGKWVDFTEYSVKVTGYYTTTYISGGSGWNGNFVVVDLEMKNNLSEERVIYWGNRLEDDNGYLYNNEIGPCLQLDSDFGGTSTCLNAEEFNPIETISGLIVFDVNSLDDSPFYLRLYENFPIWDDNDYYCKISLQQ